MADSRYQMAPLLLATSHRGCGSLLLATSHRGCGSLLLATSHRRYGVTAFHLRRLV